MTLISDMKDSSVTIWNTAQPVLEIGVHVLVIKTEHIFPNAVQPAIREKGKLGARKEAHKQYALDQIR